jgi:hypothetical protein
MKYRFYGRLMPRVDEHKISCPIFEGSNELGIKIKGSFSCKNSECKAEIETDSTDFETVRNLVEYTFRIYVDSLGYLSGEHTDVFIDRVKFESGKNLLLKTRHDDIWRDSHLRSLNQSPDRLAELVTQNVALREALTSLKHATRIHDRTGMYSYRAVEAIQDYFGEDWGKLNSTLNLHRSWADEVALFAKPQRHGATMSMSPEERTTLLKRAYAVVDRFILFLDAGEVAPLSHLPELFCDGKGTHSQCLNPSNKNHKVATP